MSGRHSDLVLVGLGSVVAALVLLAGRGAMVLTVAAGVPLTLVLPGYALTRAVLRDRLRCPAD